MTFEKKKKKINTKTLLFYIAFMAWPVLQFAIFYIVVNLNSFLLAFQKLDVNTGEVVSWGLDHFSVWFKEGLDHTRLIDALGVSFKAYFIHLVIAVPTGLIFSYYIFKRLPASMFFRVMLYLPSILSAIVLVLIYSYFISSPLKDILKTIFSASEDSYYLYQETQWVGANTVSFPVLMFYNIFVGFGTSVLLYSNKMSSVSPDLVEAAQLDGVNTWQEFANIIMPCVYPTLSVFLITGIAGIFINQYNAYPLTSGTPRTESTTIGYLMYDNVLDAGSNLANKRIGQTAALGLMLTVVVIPVTFLVRYLLLKFGPSEE